MADCEKCEGTGYFNGPSGEGAEMYCPDCLRDNKPAKEESEGEDEETRRDAG